MSTIISLKAALLAAAAASTLGTLAPTAASAFGGPEHFGRPEFTGRGPGLAPALKITCGLPCEYHPGWPHQPPRWPGFPPYGPGFPPRGHCHWSFCYPHPITWHPIYPPPVVVAPPVVYSPPVSVPRPVIYTGSSAPVYVARPASTAAVPVSAPAATCVPSGAFISVVFQPSVTAADITAFLQGYHVTMGDGPSADGVYRLRLSDGSLSPDQYGQLIASMRTQTNIISSVT